MKVTLKEIA